MPNSYNVSAVSAVSAVSDFSESLEKDNVEKSNTYQTI